MGGKSEASFCFPLRKWNQAIKGYIIFKNHGKSNRKIGVREATEKNSMLKRTLERPGQHIISAKRCENCSLVYIVRETHRFLNLHIIFGH